MKLSQLGLMTTADTLDNAHRLSVLVPERDYDEPLITRDEFVAAMGDGPLMKEFVYESDLKDRTGQAMMAEATMTKWLVDLLMFRLWTQMEKAVGREKEVG